MSFLNFVWLKIRVNVKVFIMLFKKCVLGDRVENVKRMVEMCIEEYVSRNKYICIVFDVIVYNTSKLV